MLHSPVHFDHVRLGFLVRDVRCAACASVQLKNLKPIGLRAEVRDFYSLETPNFTSAIVAERQHNVVVSGGLILRF